MPSITIFGATGHLARPVIDAFLAAGWAVRALVRDEAAARAKLPAVVQLVPGDLRDAAAVARALAGAECVYCNLSIRPGEKEGTDGWRWWIFEVKA